ncbi:sigma-E processing peptidase SpoIIGA [[Clostridium] colinum]|uniref:sigma-E processing peptidase SpoIIGA n=1 Tax=[Clostridium] colinum TaxID=36835 RepID=UPI0020250A32|nr:sigma-E processing peptidase SpoIIGA [[Clostridium] colinum]
MQIEVYIDVLFFINFIMVYFIFFIVNKLNKNKTSLKKIALGAFLATILYILTIIFVPYNKILSIFIIFFIFIISIIISFKPKNIKEFSKLFLMVNIVAFCIGGGSIAIFYYTNFNYFLNFTLQNLPLKFLIISIICTYIIIKIFLSWYKRIFLKKQSFYNITLYKNNTNVSLNALLDTGNTLKEPITKKPVIIAEFVALKPILPENLKVIFYEKQENDLYKLMELGHTADIRLIPFKSVGKENGMLIGIKIDKLEIDTENKIILKDAIVAISNFNLSNDNFYNALLNPELINCFN